MSLYVTHSFGKGVANWREKRKEKGENKNKNKNRQTL
jgi:hypothetical protein